MAQGIMECSSFYRAIWFTKVTPGAQNTNLIKIEYYYVPDINIAYWRVHSLKFPWILNCIGECTFQDSREYIKNWVGYNILKICVLVIIVYTHFV